METSHEQLHLDKRNLVQWKIEDMPTSIIWIITFVNRPFEYGDGGIFKLLRWMRNFRQSTWYHEILYADTSSKDKLLLIISLLRKTKIRTWRVVETLNTYFISWTEFMKIYTETYEVLYIERSWTYLQVLFSSLLSIREISNMAVVRHFEVMLWQTLNSCV
jgi:hypothetical protein